MVKIGFKKRVALVTLLFLGGLLEKAQAVSSIRPICPVEFEGVVVRISQPEAPFLNSTFLEKVKVTFSVSNALKGEVSNEKELVVLKNGPVKFQEEKSYRVSLNNDLLCNVNEI